MQKLLKKKKKEVIWIYSIKPNTGFLKTQIQYSSGKTDYKERGENTKTSKEHDYK